MVSRGSEVPFNVFVPHFPFTDTAIITLSPRIKVGELVEPFRGQLTLFKLRAIFSCKSLGCFAAGRFLHSKFNLTK